MTVSTDLPRLLIDVTQYVSWPAKSGVQRVLLHLTRDWPSARFDGRFGFIERGRYVTGPVSIFGAEIDSAFHSSNGGVDSDFVRRSLLAAADEIVAVSDVESVFDAYLLPEPTLHAANLAVAPQLEASKSISAFFVYFDALPLTHPQFYPRRADGNGRVTRYHQIVASASNVAFISPAIQRLFELRVARRRTPNGIVARPGADGLPRIARDLPDRPTFTIFGTVEPRKRHRVVLEAFEQLWSAGRDFRLVVVGSSGWEHEDLISRLRALAATPRVEWIERAGDEDVSVVLSRSWAVLFTPCAEGYGLPPLEALAAGCPVVVAKDLPALEGVPEAGQIRLDHVTTDAIVSAVEALAQPERNTEYRDAIGELPLPTWREFTSAVEDWIASTLARNRNRAESAER